MKSKKEYIFIRGEYKSSKEAFEEWEKYDSNTRRILYYAGKYDRDEVEYIRVKKEEETIVISYIREEIKVFQNSEFIKKNCIAYIKINNKEKKVTTKKWSDVLYEIKILIKSNKRNDRILDLLEIDFLKQKDKSNYDDVFRYISNETILKNLMLKKITNEKNLFRTYFKSRFNIYKLNRARIEWRTRLGYLITCVLREGIPDKNKLKDLENLNKSLKEIQDEGNKENPRK